MNTFLGFAIPKEVKDNVRAGIDYYNEYRRGADKEDIKTAKTLNLTASVNFQFVRKMHGYFEGDGKKVTMSRSIPTNSYIRWMMWGGEKGKEWVSKIVESRETREEKAKEEMKNAFRGC